MAAQAPAADRSEHGLRKDAIGFIEGLIMLTKSVKNFLFIGVGPAIGSLILGYLFYKAIVEYAKVDDPYSGSQAVGIAIPVVLGLGLLLHGVVLMILWRLGGHRDFFGRRPETVDPDVAAGHKAGVGAVPEAV